MNFATGQTVLYNVGNSASPVASFSLTNAVTNFQFISGQHGVELVAGDTKGGVSPVPANLATTITTRLLNWTELPTVQ